MSLRFRDNGQTLYEFGTKFLVRCPRCQSCAKVLPLDANKIHLFDPRRVTCSHCGYARDWAERSIALGGPTDWYFRLPLWLQTPCCGETLWTCNEAHLDFLEQYVRATLREDGAKGGTTARNKTVASRLPRWMKSAKNREEVMKGVGRLRKLL